MISHARRAPICVPKLPPLSKWKDLAKQAQAIRPDNVPEGLDLETLDTTPGKLALDIKLRWPKSGVSLSVGFLDTPPSELRRAILQRMNAWNRTANVLFRETNEDADNADVRIARQEGGGHWSWLGIDIQNHPGEPTMNLDGFSIETPDSELDRVVCHETGHTLGFPHEHLRKEFVELLDEDKTIQYFMDSQGWSEADVRFQLLTPLEDGSILATARPDARSIMCYDIPAECTKNGVAIIGGTVIDASDFEFAGRVYPKPR
jgi:hypothetical protein